MSRRIAREGPNPLEWVETATHLLRSAPIGALFCYYIGSMPCLLGLLYFWTDMSRGAFAGGHLIESALTAALLYLWMKCWQAAFFSKLRAHLLMEEEAPWTFQRVVWLVVAQAAFQPIGLFLRFIAANILVPYIWTYSLFISAAMLGDGTTPSLGAIGRGALREAGLWWRQTHLALLGLFGFAFFIFLNVISVAGMLPFALRTFLGIETPLTRDPLAMFNSTFFATCAAITYLCFDPLRKAVFLIRHFQGSSIQSGEDMRVALKAIGVRSRAAVVALVLLCIGLSLAPVPVRAEDPPPKTRVESTQLNDSLDHVLERREYAWRFPRNATEEAQQKGWLSGFFDSLAKTVRGWLHQVGKWMDRLAKWLRDRFRSKDEQIDKGSSDIDWNTIARRTLIILGIALVGVTALILWRSRKNLRLKPAIAQAVAVTPDLNEESVTADLLPEDSWLHMGRDLLSKGELRLAMRAFYLATLAHLGSRDLIRLARHKSNHDYDRELQRRARGNNGLLDAFDQNLLAFERVWYGDHEATPQALDFVSQNIERMRTC